jgi:Arc/MetJ-type ribon-helix-helix transcriptional regulator
MQVGINIKNCKHEFNLYKPLKSILLKINIYFLNKKEHFFTYKILYIYVSILTTSQKKGEYMARVLISMPEDFLNRIDQVADGENRSRSELIREALRTYIYKQKIKESTGALQNANLLESLLS